FPLDLRRGPFRSEAGRDRRSHGRETEVLSSGNERRMAFPDSFFCRGRTVVSRSLAELRCLLDDRVYIDHQLVPTRYPDDVERLRGRLYRWSQELSTRGESLGGDRNSHRGRYVDGGGLAIFPRL